MPSGAVQVNCDEAIFYRDFKKCSLYQTKSEEQSDFKPVDDNTKTRILRIKKVSKFLNVKKDRLQQCQTGTKKREIHIIPSVIDSKDETA